MSPLFTSVLWTLIKVAFALFAVGLNIAGLLGWVERKQSAVLQDRIGANRADILGFRILGLFHPIADAVKMLTKEDFVPTGVNRLFHTMAPCFSLGFAFLGLAAIPYGGVVHVAGGTWSLVPIESPVGLLFVLAMLGMGLHGVMMAGWASNSNYALLGGLRGAAQMISYEICMGAILAAPAFLYGTLNLETMVEKQAGFLWGMIPNWGCFTQPLAFILFLVAGTALSKRTPFDLPEGEAEIVGYHVEYSGMKFGMFLMTDFIETIVVSGLAVAIFLGGWQIPGVALDGLLGAALMLVSFITKLMVVLFVLMQIRWTLPRFRFDQLLSLGWKNILPLALANFLVTVWGIYLWR